MSIYEKENPAHLRESLNSIINQTLKPSEIVLVKDGPVGDWLDEVIDNFDFNNKELLKIISLAKNVGLGNALNIGLLNCSNELVARMDSDDICLPNRFELQVQEFMQDSKLVICSGYILEFEDNVNNILGTKKVPIANSEILKYSKYRNPFNHMAIMYKKSKVIEVGNYIDVSLAEDYYLWVRMLSKGYKAINIDKPLVYARAGKTMIKRRGGLAYAKKIVNLQKLFYKMNYISYFQFIMNCTIRIIISIIPSGLRKTFYKNILRSDN